MSESSRDKLVQSILEDILSIKMLIYKHWNQFNELIKINSGRVVQKWKGQYEDKVRERLNGNIERY